MANPDDKKSWTGWTRDAAMFAAGFVAGGATAVGIGHATNSIRTPEEREAANKADAAAAAKKG